MATNNNNNRNNMNNGNVTKVICANCGAEIIIPNEEIKHVVGTVIGQNSGMGTIILPTKGGNKGAVGHSQESVAVHADQSKPSASDALEQLKVIAKLNPQLQKLVDAVSEEIEGGSYIDVEGIVRRWIPSQFLSMMYSSRGFHASLNVKGYNYSWKVLINELKHLEQSYKLKDKDDFADRLRWYNRSLVLDMMFDYISKLTKHMNALPVKHFKRHEYIKLSCSWLNDGKGVFVDEIELLCNAFIKLAKQASQTDNIGELCEITQKFNDLRLSVHWNPDFISKSFANAYKAAGAYYTMKDLILFEGCFMVEYYRENHGKINVVFADQERSLSMLDEMIDDMVKSNGISDGGYRLLGFIKEFLEVNQFDWKKTTEKWAGQSKIRREARRNNRINRRIK